MEQQLDISEVARRTGLTARALRFYEARGLLKSARSAGGRRRYGPAALERLHQVLALKRAGLTLAQIRRLIDRRPPDLGRIIDAQLEALEDRAAELEEARRLLLSVRSRIERGESVDVGTFCSLIRQGDAVMESSKWQQVIDRYFTEEKQAAWQEKMAKMPEVFHSTAYAAQWKELSARIEAALPLDPGSQEAQAFVDEWFALLEPFSAVATPEMWQDTYRMYEDRDNWPAAADPGFTKTVWDFINRATRHRIANGGTIKGPAWMAET